MSDAQDVAQLKSLGPRFREMLTRSGIHDAAQLRALGSVEAFVRVRRCNPGVSLNLLWALESALTGEPWQQVARIHRLSLLLAVEQREQQG